MILRQEIEYIVNGNYVRYLHIAEITPRKQRQRD